MNPGSDGGSRKTFHHRGMKKSVLYPFLLTLDTLEMFLSRSGGTALAKILLGLGLFWFLYVPAHELLHAAGCLVIGGEVRELTLEPWYGADFLKMIFPFVVSGSAYAGQLTDFFVPGRFSYLLVDLFPYIPSLFGVSFILFARRKMRALLFGPAVLLAFIPLMAVPGDFYEAVSLFTSPALAVLAPGTPENLLVSDDAVKSFLDLKAAGRLDFLTLCLFSAGLFFSTLLAFGTLLLQGLIARMIPNLLDKDPLKR